MCELILGVILTFLWVDTFYIDLIEVKPAYSETTEDAPNDSNTTEQEHLDLSAIMADDSGTLLVIIDDDSPNSFVLKLQPSGMTT